MSIKIQHQEMTLSAKRINAQTEKLNRIQKELQTMLNSATWDMRVRRSMESKLEEARRLNSELTLIVKNMSQMVDTTAESMREKDNQLSKLMGEETSNTTSTNDKYSNTGNSYTGNNISDNKSDDGGLSFLDTDVQLNLLGSLSKDDDGTTGKDAEIGIGLSGSIIEYEEEANIGNSALGLGGGVDIDVGHVTLEGGLVFDFNEWDAYLGGEAGIYAGKGELSGEIDLGPVSIGGGVSGLYGAGLQGQVGIDDGKLTFGGGVALGLGASAFLQLGLNKDWFDEYIFKTKS